jgi:DNA mismatch repair protein MSH6
LGLGEPGAGDEQWQHLQLAFLKPENIKDKDGHRPDHPEYNPRTLYVPRAFLDECTPVSSVC